MTTLNEEKKRGEDAQYLLEHPLLVETLSQMRSNLHEQWSRSKTSEGDKREGLYRMLHTLNAFEKNLVTMVQTGKMAAMQLSVDETRAKRARQQTPDEGLMN